MPILGVCFPFTFCQSCNKVFQFIYFFLCCFIFSPLVLFAVSFFNFLNWTSVSWEKNRTIFFSDQCLGSFFCCCCLFWKEIAKLKKKATRSGHYILKYTDYCLESILLPLKKKTNRHNRMLFNSIIGDRLTNQNVAWWFVLHFLPSGWH